MAQLPVKVLSLNCNGLNNKLKSKRILSALVKSRADIIFLQETHLKQPSFKSRKFSIQIQACGNSKSQGVAVLLLAKFRTVVQDQP